MKDSISLMPEMLTLLKLKLNMFNWHSFLQDTCYWMVPRISRVSTRAIMVHTPHMVTVHNTSVKLNFSLFLDTCSSPGFNTPRNCPFSFTALLFPSPSLLFPTHLLNSQYSQLSELSTLWNTSLLNSHSLTWENEAIHPWVFKSIHMLKTPKYTTLFQISSPDAKLKCRAFKKFMENACHEKN